MPLLVYPQQTSQYIQDLAKTIGNFELKECWNSCRNRSSSMMRIAYVCWPHWHSEIFSRWTSFFQIILIVFQIDKSNCMCVNFFHRFCGSWKTISACCICEFPFEDVENCLWSNFLDFTQTKLFTYVTKRNLYIHFHLKVLFAATVACVDEMSDGDALPAGADQLGLPVARVHQMHEIFQRLLRTCSQLIVVTCNARQ